MQLSIDGGGHLSYAQLTASQVKYLQLLLIEADSSGADGHVETLATAARWAIDQAHHAWEAEGQQDGPGG